MQIYSIPSKANGIERFLNLVRQAGHRVDFDGQSGRYLIQGRHEDAHYGPHADITVIRQEEIGSAIEEVEELNKPQDLAPRLSSLQDLLSQRAAVQPTQEDEETEPSEDLEAGEGQPDTENELEESEFAETTEFGEADDEGEDDAEAINPDFIEDDEASQEVADFTALQQVAETLSESKKVRIFNAIRDVLDVDLTDTSDVLQTLSETAGLKKSLSTLLSLLNVEVSVTAISRDYKVQPKTVTFSADRTENLENYRRGVAQAMIQIQTMLASVEKTEELEKSLKSVESALEQEKRNGTTKSMTLQQENDILKAKLVPQMLRPAKFLIYWTTPTEQTAYLTVQPGAKSAAATPDAPFEAATKRCSASFKQNEAHKFETLESAVNQVKRLKQWAKNCEFFEGEQPELFVARLGLDIVA